MLYFQSIMELNEGIMTAKCFGITLALNTQAAHKSIEIFTKRDIFCQVLSGTEGKK